MCGSVVVTIGLVMDIAGVFVLVWCGSFDKLYKLLSSRPDKDGNLVFDAQGDSEQTEKLREKARQMDKWGLWLIIGGFLLQAIGIWLA